MIRTYLPDKLLHNLSKKLSFFQPAKKQETLKKMRDVDDKIIYALNTTIPTESFKGQISASETCKVLHGRLTEAHKHREDRIKTCIKITAERVMDLKAQRDVNNGDIVLDKSFKTEQRKVLY